ncbi:MAG: SpoVA/SpoVAEb family sporulation membrane protein [Eggerthellaceae bacterium]|nr:SpoVA/SpoVAEb family sporulation membrane protein [Eggerthellaceae bacterium]
MEIAKQVGRAFLTGGVLALMAEIVRVVLLIALGETSPFVIPLTLMIMCLFAVVTFPSGLYNKWTEFGFIGAMLPISGLTAGVAAAYCGARKATGSVAEGVKAGIMLVVRLSGSGLVVAFVVALVVSFVL